MGVQIIDILKRHEVGLDFLSGKVIAIDASNHLYQFLTTIRAPDGSPFTDSKGNITSHLIGLFSRTANLMQKNIRLIYVFDGPAPRLKHRELESRKEAKRAAAERYEAAIKANNLEDMRKFAGRFARLTPDMVSESKKLLEALGIPFIDAPSEGEAQAAHIVKKGNAFASASQDADSLLFGTKRLVRNLSITGRRKKQLSYSEISPELIVLDENLCELGITQDQLIALGMLVGTDYNSRGIKGVGPVRALELVKKHGDSFSKLFEEVCWDRCFDVPWTEIFDFFKNIPVTDQYELSWGEPDRNAAVSLLCGMHDFSVERVEKTMDALSKRQKGLGEYF
ncbi:flap endonuclease-1 [Candidatus Woesearchaeota archaeon]|nr:flap endonuclease-1 [Candidatus Woesearchaeota archaeon]